MSSAKGNPGVESGQVELPNPTFFDKIGPGGIYYRYSLIAIAFLSLTLLTFLIFIFWPKKSPTPTLTLRPGQKMDGNGNVWEPYKGEPKPLTMSGKQIYQISGSVDGAPKISEVSFDPIDVKKGGTQTITVKVVDTVTEVTDVIVTMWTDNKSVPVTLKLASGTTKDGWWSGTFKLDDTYDYIYHATIFAKNKNSKAMSTTVTFK